MLEDVCCTVCVYEGDSPRSTPHHPLPSIGHTHEGLGDLPFTPEEDEEEHRGAGEPMEDVEEMDSEAGGGSDDEETTLNDHPHYPVLHDPVAPLLAPTRVSIPLQGAVTLTPASCVPQVAALFSLCVRGCILPNCAPNLAARC